MAKRKGLSFALKERSRPALRTGRLAICQLGGDDIKDNRAVLQAQLLVHRFNVSNRRAKLLVSMIWGDAA